MNEEKDKIEESEEYKEYLKNRKYYGRNIGGDSLFLDDIAIDCEGKKRYNPEINFNLMGCNPEDNDKTKTIKCIEFAINNLENKKNTLNELIQKIKKYDDEIFVSRFKLCDFDSEYGTTCDTNDIYIDMYEKIYESFDEYKNRICTEKQNLKKNREEKILNCKQNIELYKKQLEELEREDET